MAKAESGDFVTVQGTITDVTTGSRVAQRRDTQGCVGLGSGPRSRAPAAQPEPADALPVDRVVRVGGTWGHGYLDHDVWGIHAQTAERVE